MHSKILNNLIFSSYPTESDSSFCVELREKMLDCLSQPFVRPVDFCICGTILASICQVFGLVEFGRVAAFLLVLQDKTIEGSIPHPSSIGNVILNVLCEASSSLRLSELNNSVMEIKKERIASNLWVDGIENGESAIEKCMTLEFRYFFQFNYQ